MATLNRKVSFFAIIN